MPESILNFWLGLGSFFAFGFMVLIAARLGEKYVFILSASFILLSNVTVQMPVEIEIPLTGWAVTISWAVIIYSMIYLMTDVLSEYFGKHSAWKLAATNLSVQILLWLYVASSLFASPAGELGDGVYGRMEQLFSTTAQVTFAAIVAAIGAFLDIAFYEYMKRRGKGRVLGSLWFRNNFSTFIGQTANTLLFFFIAFNGVLATSTIWEIAIAAIIVKIAIAICDTGFIYLAKYFIHHSEQDGNGVVDSPATQ